MQYLLDLVWLSDNRNIAASGVAGRLVYVYRGITVATESDTGGVYWCMGAGGPNLQ